MAEAAKIGFMADTVSSAAKAAAAGVTAGLVASQTRFSVDPEQAQKLIDGLVEARDKLQDLEGRATDIVTIDSPGKDAYSGIATMAIRKAAGGEAGGYIWANQQAYTALNNTIQNIQAALDTYRNQEQQTTDAFRGQGSES